MRQPNHPAASPDSLATRNPRRVVQPAEDWVLIIGEVFGGQRGKLRIAGVVNADSRSEAGRSMGQKWTLAEKQRELLGKKFGGWTVTGAIDGLHVLEVARGTTSAVLKLPRDQAGWKSRERFHSEVGGLRKLGQRPGVVPLIDFGKTANTPWFVMPRAELLAKKLGATPNLRDVIEAAAELAATLAGLHSEDLTHRDIKPANLFWLEGSPVFGDFGIAGWNARKRVTRVGEPMGSAHFLAPEARLTEKDMDYKPGDIWALAKSIHVLANPEQGPYPPGGTHYPGVAIFSMQLSGDQAAEELEQLMEACTAIRPGHRPTAAELSHELNVWLRHHPAGSVRRYPYPPRGRFRRFGDATTRADMLRHNQTTEFVSRMLSQTTYSLGLDLDLDLGDNAPLLSLSDDWVDEDGDYNGPDMGPRVATKFDAAGRRAVLGSVETYPGAIFIAEIHQNQPDTGGVRVLTSHESQQVNPEFPSGRDALDALIDWAANQLGVERTHRSATSQIDDLFTTANLQPAETDSGLS